ncbi:archaeal DNA polymerase I / intein-containing [Halarchaeum acidiphilum MH1-52-1]|uniref:DNA-directed DNA polymerase n=1 Tax=Halarchaeum acidiphilum MH1-52-1 TaxID=1261545 RepID=U2YCN6_9EURY|nr:3'-5' exonuclease [Halarchaeum acidiphilum]GAD51356.1 archaeal DNA polymerase I / intein-containing [Halarchaeum acidiphilum MH1-52-1]
MSNASLTDFSSGSDAADGGDGADASPRPDEEARYVAGDDDPVVSEVFDAESGALPDVDATLDLMVTQVDYTVEGSGERERPVIHVFGRTSRNDVEHVRVHGFRPYFYAPTDSLDEEDLAKDVITGHEAGYESIRGDDLTKIYGRTPRDVGNIRDEYDHYEADILFPNRFLIDKDVNSGIRVPARRAESDGALVVRHDEVEPVEAEADLRVTTFDIEVDDRNGFPEEGEEPIVCLSSHDSYRDEYVAWLQTDNEGDAPAPDDLSGYDLLDEESGADIDVRVFEEEAAMLEAFLDYVIETDPDCMTGWNFEDFDAPYFIDRLEELNPHTDRDLDYNRLSRVNEVWRSDWQGPNVKGRVVFDLLYAYQRTQFSELDSYRLDAVGETELGVGKERYAGDIGDLWEDDPERLLEYNVRDVELCVEIDRKQDVIDFWEEVASFVGCKLEDATTPGDAVDVYVLHKAHGRFALPSKGRQESEDYEGGAVFDPITGVKENVTVLDLKCFSGDTDLLTPDGVRNITDVDVGDPVYTLNPETFECEVKPVEQTHHYPNKYGELHHLSGTTHDLKVTENHRFLASSKRRWDEQTPDDFEFTEYRNLADAQRYAFPSHEPMDGDAVETFDLYNDVDDGYAVVYSDDDLRVFRAAMPDTVTESLTLVHGSAQALEMEKTGKYLVPIDVFREHETRIREFSDHVFLKYDRQHRETPLSFEMADWLELVGWYVTEGSTDRENGRFTLHQDDESGRTAIRDLLDRMGINYNLDDRGVNVSNRYLLEWLSENCGEGYANKRLPEGVFELDSTLLDRLLRTMIAGDGTAGDESTVSELWTKSDPLKEGFVQLAVRCGHKPTVTKQSDGTWYVSIGKRGSFNKSANASVEDHDGDVHCVTAADNHVVLAGRNGHFQWVGQSLYPMAMRTINASPETKVDPQSYDGDTFHAPNGTHFREEPDGIIREIIEETLNEREEKKGLRSEHDPGTNEYERYDRQQAAVKVIMNCFTPDTDVLTPDGVRNIRDLDVGDTVYSLDPETMRLEEKPVVETQAYPDYRGDLVDVETSEIDFSVTPNHRMLVRQDDANGASWDDYRFVEAGDLNPSSHYEIPHDWSMAHGDPIEEVDLTEHVEGDYEVWVRPSVHGQTFTSELGWTPRRVPKADVGQTGYVFTAEEFEAHREYVESVCETGFVHRESGRKWIPRTYDGDDFLDLLAWYVTEGTVHTSEDERFGENSRGSATTVTIAQDAVADGGETDDHARVGALLDRMGFDYYVDDRAYQVTSRLLGDLLEALCGENSSEKRIPEFVFDASERQKRRFLDTLVAGDGDRQANSWRYTTSSDRLRDDVLRLCAHLGETASYDRDGGSCRIYCTEGAKNSFRMHRSGGTSTAEDGVYCVTVEDNHTLLAGRNGKFQFVGQSLYGVLGWERFRLYDKEMGAAVTATGRDVIEFTADAAGELDYEIAYGDSVTGDRPVVVRDPEGRVRITPIAELFERAARSENVLVTADGGPVTSASVGKDRRTLDGWDASR